MHRLILACAVLAFGIGVSGETAHAQRAMAHPLPRPVAAKPAAASPTAHQPVTQGAPR